MFAQVFVGRWYGISRCFYGDKGNMSGSPEFRPGKVLTDKQNEKVSSLASAIQSLLTPHPSFPFLQSRLQSASAPPPTKSSISPPACLIPHLAIYTCVCKCHLFHPPLFSIYLIFLLCCHYALFLTFSLTLFAPPLFKALLTLLFSFSLITPLLPSTPHSYLI